jgi:hypothetical protein
MEQRGLHKQMFSLFLVRWEESTPAHNVQSKMSYYKESQRRHCRNYRQIELKPGTTLDATDCPWIQ